MKSRNTRLFYGHIYSCLRVACTRSHKTHGIEKSKTLVILAGPINPDIAPKVSGIHTLVIHVKDTIVSDSVCDIRISVNPIQTSILSVNSMI